MKTQHAVGDLDAVFQVRRQDALADVAALCRAAYDVVRTLRRAREHAGAYARAALALIGWTGDCAGRRPSIGMTIGIPGSIVFEMAMHGGPLPSRVQITKDPDAAVMITSIDNTGSAALASTEANPRDEAEVEPISDNTCEIH